MDYLNIKVPDDTEIIVVGDIHEHEEQFLKLLKLVEPSDSKWLVSAGDLYDKGFGFEVGDKIADYFKSLSEQKIGWIVRGNHEISKFKKRSPNNLTKALTWLSTQPLALSFFWNSGFRLTVLHGGVTPSHTWEDLSKDANISKIPYIRDLDQDGNYIPLVWKKNDGIETLLPEKEGGRSWHLTYDGRFGYIAAGHEPQKDGIAKLYSHSCNLDSAVYHTGILSAKYFNKFGEGKLITVNGIAKQSLKR